MSNRCSLRAIYTLLAVCLLAVPGFVLASESVRLAAPTERIGPRHVDVALEVGGDLKLTADGKKRSVPMSVVAALAYDERAAGAAPGRRVLRHYQKAEAVIKIDKSTQQIALPDDRRSIALQSVGETPMLYSPAGPLTREHLDLIEFPASRILPEDLLPSDAVKPGDSWKISEATIAAMLSLDAVDFAEVQGVFGEVAGDEARIAVAGTVRGAVAGVSSEIQIKAKLAYSVKLAQVTSLNVFIEEKRSIGHVGPGLDVAAKLTMKLSPVDEPSRLSPDELSALPESPAAELVRLEYQSQRGSYRFAYDRRWFVTSDEQSLLVLRMVDRGELVAQCSIAPLPAREGKTQLTLEQFQDDVQRSLGKSFGQFVHASQLESPEKYRVLRVVATGEVSELPIRWVYYLIANEQGQQVSAAFTLEQSLEERFGSADRDLTASIRLLEPAATAARSSRLPAK